MEKHVAAFKGHQMAVREIEAVSKTIPQVQWFTQTVFSRDSTSAGKKELSLLSVSVTETIKMPMNYLESLGSCSAKK